MRSVREAVIWTIFALLLQVLVISQLGFGTGLAEVAVLIGVFVVMATSIWWSYAKHRRAASEVTGPR